MREGSKEWEKGMIGNSDGEEEVAKRGIWSPVFRREQGQGYCRKGSWIYQWGHFGLRNKVDQNLGAKDWGLNWWPQGSGSSYELTLSKVYSSRIWKDSSAVTLTASVQLPIPRASGSQPPTTPAPGNPSSALFWPLWALANTLMYSPNSSHI